MGRRARPLSAPPGQRRAPGKATAGFARLAPVVPLCLLAASAEAVPPPPWVGLAPGVVAGVERDLPRRALGRPGDPKLENAAAVAVVRRRDGALIDFFRRGAVVPTSDQLGTSTDLDGLWDLVPVAVSADERSTALEHASVRSAADAVLVEGELAVAGRRVRLIARYAIDPIRPRVSVELTFAADGALPRDLELGVAVRWGNVAYRVEGVGPTLPNFDGRVRWAGRHGAGGDLLLRALEPEAFQARFVSEKRGFQGALQALVPSRGRERVRVRYELSYEPLPSSPPQARAPEGELEARVRDERGRPLAAKLTLLRDGRAQPLFPDDGGLDGAAHFVWAGAGSARTRIPAGRYEVLVSAGPERALVRRSLTVKAKGVARLDAELAHVVPTPGWVAADLHLHQAPSVDADISLEARLVAVAAEGIELAVATDHYAVTDFGPTLEALLGAGALGRPLVTVVGSELSTVGERFGHFNVFPLPLGARIEYEDTTPARLFASARAASPGGVLQVNHPRWRPALGYFTRYELDPATGKPGKPGFDASFDAIEVYNGYEAEDREAVERVLADFLRLLGSGRRYVATGSSDSHKLAFLDPGVPRTLIAHDGSDDDRLPLAAEALANLKAGRALVTSGPIVEASLAGAGPGQTARGVGPLVDLRVRVRAAPWISADRVVVLAGPDATIVHDLAIPASTNVLRFERALRVRLDAPTFFVVLVRGDKPLPNTFRDDILPLAFTNPIWAEP